MAATEATKTTSMGDEDIVTEAAKITAEDDVGEAAAAIAVEEEDETEAKSPFYKVLDDPRIFIKQFKASRGRKRVNQRISMYVERSKRLLRGHETIRIHGIEEGMGTACAVVEILRREGIAVIVSMGTNLNVQPRFTQGRRGRAYFAGNYLSMDFVLGRGENAMFVTDRKQRKLIALFESKDTDKNGTISKADAEAFNMGEAFYSTEDEKKSADDYAATLGDEITMPEFIKYASEFINHNLRVPVFFQRCEEMYGLKGKGGRGGRRGKSGGADKDDDSS